jgi:hypothetical protein
MRKVRSASSRSEEVRSVQTSVLLLDGVSNDGVTRAQGGEKGGEKGKRAA